jgi:undecaprenyl-phosphate galactose phosphotransferase/putative colanic acid biosynthesis UDP-glucose lipid carrier transferase
MIGKRYSKYLRAIFLLCDLFMLNLALFLSCLIVFREFDRILTDTNILLFILFNLIWFISSEYFNLYNLQRFTRSENIIVRLTKTTAITFLLVFVIAFVLKYYLVSRYMIYYSFEIFFILAVLFRILLIPLIGWYRKAGYNYVTLIIIGAGPVGIEVMKELTADMTIGLKFLGFFDDNPDKSSLKHKVIGKVEDAKSYVLENKVDEVIVTLPDFAGDKVKDLIRFCEFNMIRIRIVPDFFRYFPNKVHLDFIGSIPFMYLREEPLQGNRNRLLKRGLDVIFSMTVIVLIFPWLIPIIGILIKSGSKGPVFFRQDRSGLNNKIFRMWKFRTMYVNADADVVQATKHDQRITPIGLFLRKTNLDEFPQFFNILAGDMSLVGPRPHMLKHTNVYSQIIDNYMVRHIVKPGLTGWAQVNGYRGETGQPEQMAMRVERDVWYIENWTFLLDLKIILLTVVNMIRGEKNAV